MEVAGKTVFITGAAKGYGKCLANDLLGKGAKVFMVDIDTELGTSTLKEFQEKFGADKVSFATMDVTNNKEYQETFDEAVEKFGQVDILINNAGVVSEVDFERTFNVNYGGTIRGTKIAEKFMRTDKGGKGGRIINVSAGAGLNEMFQLPVFCGASHAIRAFTSSMAQQPDTRGVEYAVVCPLVMGDMINYDGEYSEVVSKLHQVLTNPYSDMAAQTMKLLETEKINGAVLLVAGQGISYQKIEVNDLGDSWTLPDYTKEFDQMLQCLNVSLTL